MRNNIQCLYQKYLEADFEDLKSKLQLPSRLIEIIKANDKAIKKANMITFFFINFYKDFEQNIIQGNLDVDKYLGKPKKTYQECMKLYNQHSINTLDLNIDEFEN